MKTSFKIIAVGTLGAIGLASAAIGQTNATQGSTSPSRQHDQMMSGMSGQGKMMGMMMKDSKTQKQMVDMMADCGKMMKKMTSASDMNNMAKD